MEKMKVWMVAGSMEYEGDRVEYSGKVFFDYEKGVKYGESLVKGEYVDKDGDRLKYDDYVIKEVEVE